MMKLKPVCVCVAAALINDGWQSHDHYTMFHGVCD